MTTDGADSVHRIIIRKSHPAMYRSIMTIGVGVLLLAGNLWFFKPTFQPLGIPFHAVSFGFLLIGVGLIVFLNLFHKLSTMRAALGVSIGYMLGWGGLNMIQAFNGKASFQLPILLLIIAVIQMWWLIESPINPMTEKR